MQKFDLVIFDCDGVLVDSELLSCQCLADALTRYGLTTDVHEVLTRFLGRSFAAVEEHYLRSVGQPLPHAFREDLFRDLGVTFRASLKPMPHIVDVLEGLDMPYCLASSSDMDRIRLTLSVTNLAPYFGDRVFNAAMVGRSKPAPDLFLFAAREMTTEPARALVVEDSVTGVAAGKAAGMTVWGFVGGSHANGDNSVEHLTDAGATRILRSMAEFSTR